MDMIISLALMVAWIWIIVIAFKNEETIWGIALIVFFPAAYVYGIMRWKTAAVPFVILCIGFAVILMTFDPSASPDLAAAKP